MIDLVDDCVVDGNDGSYGDNASHRCWGVGVDPNTITASWRALLNAHERHDH